MGLVFVDCEAQGPCPSCGQLTEFGAVIYEPREPLLHKTTYHGIITTRDGVKPLPECEEQAFGQFHIWLKARSKGRPIFVSDNPAWDFQWIQDGFHRIMGENPFGHSARRISDFYAGLTGDFRNTQKWKQLRETPHDHNPVNDAMGNLEAFERMLKGERA